MDCLDKFATISLPVCVYVSRTYMYILIASITIHQPDNYNEPMMTFNEAGKCQQRDIFSALEQRFSESISTGWNYLPTITKIWYDLSMETYQCQWEIEPQLGNWTGFRNQKLFIKFIEIFKGK